MEKVMDQREVELIKKKSAAGILALTSRTFALQIIAFSATFLLTIFLSPQVFGVFFVVSAIISFLNYFSDIGLAAALIQKKEALTEEDLTTTFTIQQILVGVVTVLAILIGDKIAAFYNLDSAGLWLLRALIGSFFLSSLKTIPSVLLERSLAFNKLIIPQILETVGFYAVAVTLAWQGWGIESFTWAVVVRAIVGLIGMYIVSPWRVTFGITTVVAKRLLRFGLPFQMNSFLALLKDDLMTVFLGKILPFAEIGYIGWAKKWADVPLRLIMDSVVRVTFPAFSRLQDSKEQMTRGIEKTLFGISLTVFPVTIGLLFFVQPLVDMIPKYAKWSPALPSFYMFAVAALIASLSTPLTNALNAVGRIKITLGLMIMWTTATWILTLVLISLYGFNGFAAAILLVSFTIGIVVKLTKRIAPFLFWKNIGTPLLAALTQGLYTFSALRFMPSVSWALAAVAVTSGILYIGLIWSLDRARISSLLASFRK